MNDEQKKLTQYNETESEQLTTIEEEPELQGRREFLIGLGKWSRAVIAGAVVGGALLTEKSAQAGWINRRGGCCRGGSWINGGGGGGWINRRGGGYGGSWINRR